jgi:hypothetical protein
MRRTLETTALAGRCGAEIVAGTVTEKVGFVRQETEEVLQIVASKT